MGNIYRRKIALPHSTVSYINMLLHMNDAWTEEEDDDIADTMNTIDNRKEQQS